MTYIVAVDDEPEVLHKLRGALVGLPAQIETLSESAHFFDVLEMRRPDLVILDVSMPPGPDGIRLCRDLRNDQRYIALPVLFLTAHKETDDIVSGLDAGADDYVVKPFVQAELVARVNALLRRGARSTSDEAVLVRGRVRMDSQSHQLTVDQTTVQLTATEHRLMRFLMAHEDQTHSPSQLLEEVWEYPRDTGDPDLVRAHIRNLRAKMPDNTGRQFVRTVHGVGYMFSVK